MTPGARLLREAPAKINLYLEVLGRRADGFHELVTVLQTVDLCDEVSVALRPRAVAGDGPDVRLAVSGEEATGDVPTDERNLAHRAARAVLERAGAVHDVGLDVELVKRIPAGGGLGGGSSDAATVVRCVDELLGDPLGPAARAEVCAALGSDVSFFLVGGTALCTGRGERVEALPAPAPFALTLGLPGVAVSTPDVYRALGAGVVGQPSLTREALVSAFADADLPALEALYRNDLEAPARRLLPALDSALRGDRVHLSGSGSTLFRLGENSAWSTSEREFRSIRFVTTRARNR